MTIGLTWMYVWVMKVNTIFTRPETLLIEKYLPVLLMNRLNEKLRSSLVYLKPMVNHQWDKHTLGHYQLGFITMKPNLFTYLLLNQAWHSICTSFPLAPPLITITHHRHRFTFFDPWNIFLMKSFARLNHFFAAL